MSSFRYLRQQALKLPQVEEGLHMGGPAFRVRGKMFALWWAEGERTILKLPRDFQVVLFDVRPGTFQPCRVGVGTWSYVDLDQLENDELGKLVRQAWSTVVPKALSRPVLDELRA
jgi:hypothetical protein